MYGVCQRRNNTATTDGRVASTSTKTNTNDADLFRFACPRTSHRAPHMVLQTTTSAPVSDREPSGSRLPPIPNPDLTGRSTGEQAVIVALQAVANYPNSSDFVRAVEQRIPGLATYLQAAAQPSGCDPPAPLVETASMDVEIAAGPSNSASTALALEKKPGGCD